jgi:ABC-2 type transport system permease protein
MVFGRGGWKGAELMQEPVYLLSGFYFPLRRLGLVIAGVASFIPIALGLDAVRQFCIPLPGGLQVFPPEVEVVILVLFTGMFVIVARRALGYMEALGKREGRLSLRWQ